jgi:hypothetical protein
MTIQIKHAFVSLKGDGTDATQVQPSYWNAAHSFTMATASLVGRLTAGVGNAEEIPISAYMAALLNTADAATLAGVLGLFETGDTKWTFRTAASPGWILMTGGTGTPPNTIGNGASAAVLRANADTFALYTVIYNGCSDSIAPVSGGRTGNATNDFNAGKTIQVPNPVGRSPIGAGANTSTTTTRTLGQGYGAESVALIAANIPSIGSTGVNSISVSGSFSAPVISNTFNSGTASNPCSYMGITTYNVTCTGNNNISVNYINGAQQNVDKLHPVIPLNVMVKL